MPRHGNQRENATELSTAIAARLKDIAAERSLDNKSLARLSGLSEPTLTRTFRNGRVLDLSELDALCNALNIRASSVVRDAERAISVPSAPSAVSVDPARAYIDETQAKLTRVLSRTDLTPAAKQHQPDPYANIGEENQDTGVQND